MARGKSVEIDWDTAHRRGLDHMTVDTCGKKFPLTPSPRT